LQIERCGTATDDPTRTFNPLVVGSIPTRLAIRAQDLQGAVMLRLPVAKVVPLALTNETM
jgi:hypothetical protein